MRKKNRNPASKESSGLREKAKGGLPDGVLACLQQTWIEQVTLDRSMAATGGEAASRMITLDLNHFGFQRAGRPERRRRVGEKKEAKKRLKNGILQSRANLNGGELDLNGGELDEATFSPG